MKNSKNFWISAIGAGLFFLSFTWDTPINNYLKNIRIPFLDAVLGVITNFGVVVLIMMIIPIATLYRKDKKPKYLLLITFFASLIFTFVLKLAIARQRPVEVLTYPFTGIINYSFPSMHAVVAFSLIAILIKSLPKQKIFWISFAILVGLSRIYFGVHYLSDVVFGALVGYFIGHYITVLYEKYYVKNK